MIEVVLRSIVKICFFTIIVKMYDRGRGSVSNEIILFLLVTLVCCEEEILLNILIEIHIT